MSDRYHVVLQGSVEVPAFCELFHTQVAVNDRVIRKGMLDLGSMACTMSEEVEYLLREAGALVQELVGCGGKRTP